jgi:ribosomal protein S18 acetylase RimI-like enzyme
MIDIRPLDRFDSDRFQAIASGYRTDAVYRVMWHEDDVETRFTLTLEPLAQPREFRFPLVEADAAHYSALVPGDFCLAAYDGETVVGIVLAEPQAWNRVLWVWEFHVAATHRGQGIGRRLMDDVAGLARAAGLRALVCETQNTNVPAIRFYRAVGYALEGIDVSYYTNDDLLPGGTVAVFMKRRLA